VVPQAQEKKSDGGVVYQEQHTEDLPEPDPLASYFPITMMGELAAPGTVFKALPLNAGMYKCFQAHRRMDRSPNKNYPLTCQVCHKADSEDRWKCQWCYVRMCGGCLHLFNNYKRDLTKLVEHIKSNPPSADPSSPSRPNSSGQGLETVLE
jgi:hypothetical protein